MDEGSDILRITPLVCPNCGNRVTFCSNGRVICWYCGELYPENDFWKIRWFEDAKPFEMRDKEKA